MPLLGLVRFFLPGSDKLIVGLMLAAVYVGVVGAAGLAYVGWRHHQYMRGWDEALAYVAKQDAKSAKVATDAKNRVDNCYDTDGDWDGAKGVCVYRNGALSGVSGLFSNN